MMRSGVLTVALVAASAAGAADGHKQMHDRQMLRLEPTTRLEQRCDARGIGEVGRTHEGMRPDELVAYAYAPPEIREHTISASGAAVRSKGIWYHLSYVCTTTPDGLDIVEFRHTLGAPVPRSEWAEHELVPP